MKRYLCLIGMILICYRVTVAQKVYLNPSDQYSNPVAGGGNEAQYAKINADKTKALLDTMGFSTKVDQDFWNSPYNANSWGATIFVSIHSNAGGGHGTETLYVSSGGKILAGAVQNGLLSKLPYQDRGLKYRNDLHVLNATKMYACLTEVVFHDCAKTSGYKGHPPSESEFLKSEDGQNKIASGIAAGICAYFNKNCMITEPPNKGWFKGVVYKAPNMDDRIQGATVTLNTGQKTISSATGYFEFELEPGTYTATAEADGFYPNSSTRTVEAGKEIWGSIGLTPILDKVEESILEEVFPETIEESAGDTFEGTIFSDEDLSQDIKQDVADIKGGWDDQKETTNPDAKVAETQSARGGGGCNNRNSSNYACFLGVICLVLFLRRAMEAG